MFNFDAKFWNTIIPLLIKPGKVSRDYVDGKRQRYSNPFRFYLTVSILFFLILGLSKSIDKFKELKNGTEKKQSRVISFETDDVFKAVDIDSLKKTVNKELKNSRIPLDAVKRKEIVGKVIEEAEDSTKKVPKNKINFGSLQIQDYLKFQKKHPKINIDEALDSLQKNKTFLNRFIYSRAKVINSLIDEAESQEQFISQLLSYGSVALFVFLPFFTLFLKLFYIRRKYTYVDHLVFVFHTQTVFFMLLSIYFLVELFGAKPQLWVFTILFLMYLLIAMHKFYQQGYFKTLIKFILLNLTYLLISIIGAVIVGLISFALY
ncbi:hypothetical protein BTO04_12265 [Polaribacter sp. SA4-10]|uniref:DUF3667 domain-containing protein n=1 Tax=Polaribacter sp. SA4-10 TaxID=754397 RepID=UPI000B584122|nr:DUF3667 domain-containing protein [Polaribacter sp. SA4-10]ARV07416.1 hypothetical protein BTO04_12265 [Polaribacter sp. SA4-10]